MNKIKLVSCSFLSLLLILTSFPPALAAFRDVYSSTPYATAINALQEQGILEGYQDKTFKPGSFINRAEFLKIVMEAAIDDSIAGSGCFPDVTNQWFASYVCQAKLDGVIEGYPDGTFKPDKNISFAEASKIMSKIYKQNIDAYSSVWYEPYVKALESAKAIPPSISKFDHLMTRGEMAEIMWRLKENKTDQDNKGFLNIKYPELTVNTASDSPQNASSCNDLKSYIEENTYDNRVYYEDAVLAPMAGAPLGLGSNKAAKQMLAESAADSNFSQTNLQVSGVDEADIVKTDGEYLYVIRDYNVYIVKANPPAKLNIESVIDLNDRDFYPSDLYIKDNKLVVIGSSYQSFYKTTGIQGSRMIAPDYYPVSNLTAVYIYDVSDKAEPKQVRHISFEGSMVSTRRIDEKLYLIMNQNVRWFKGDPKPVPLAEDVLPSYQDSENEDKTNAVTDCQDVIVIPHIPRPEYIITAVIPVDGSASQIERKVVLGSAENIYASLENLYIATTDYQYNWNYSDSGSNEKTNLYRFTYTDDGLSFKAVGSVPGRVLNQFSMDEYNKHFRIATTVGNVVRSGEDSSGNNLYVLNMDLKTVGKIEDIAPGEQIYSARFMGSRGYLVTFKNTDPFFAIDLKDPENPVILGKLKIPGYSDYLHPYDEDHIIGFGKDTVASSYDNFAWYQGIKMAIFKVTDPENPIQLHKFIIGDRGTDSPLLHNHKALLFENERNLFAFPVKVAKISDEEKAKNAEGNAYGDTVFQGAYVFGVDLENGFNLKGSITHYTQEDRLKSGSYLYGKDIERIVRISDSLYTISEEGVQAHSEDTIEFENGITYAGEPTEKVTGDCPANTDGAWFASTDPNMCEFIDFDCPDNQTKFSGDCGCGCIR